MTILYADDDRDDLDLFSNVVKQVNPSYTVILADNGVDAIKILSQADANKPDIIFLDVNMPLMDGFETLVEIRKDKRYRDTKIILYSYGIIPEMQAAYKAFNVQFVRKHNAFNDIKKSIEQVIGR
jgi:CheY-like chemotaxis protein